MDHSAIHCMYYVAIVCPEETDRRVKQYKQWMKDNFNCTVALKSPAHITLVPPFWIEEAKEATLLQALRSFPPLATKMEIYLEGFSHFGNRVLFIAVKENPALDKIRRQVEKHFIEASDNVIKADDRPFHPHVTIANRDMKPGDFIKAWAHFSGKKSEEAFNAGNLSLLKLSPGKWNIVDQVSL